MQSSTFSEFASIPSAQGDQFRSIKSEVSTDVDADGYVVLGADFTIADGRAIASFGVGFDGYPENFTESDIESARRDLEFFKAQFDEWYEVASSALTEAATYAGVSD